ncbi:MAG: hypothetical protein L6R40_003045 [Gallowayella cf. fulva]|nr:MAG: hypothetical protein L6R40_003045 [Xanthomendoza cf. fulva]
MSFEPEDVTSQGAWEVLKELIDGRWLAILQHPCSFSPEIFEHVTLNLIHNPNINSSLLFRADILYDSADLEKPERVFIGSEGLTLDEILNDYSITSDGFPAFTLKRTIVRKMVPRNPQLDKPVAQTCQIFQSIEGRDLRHTLVIYTPHISSSSEIPWYHPHVRSLAYLHSWRSSRSLNCTPSVTDSSLTPLGNISVHYRLFPDQVFPLSDRLLRTAHHLLATLYKHGQGTLNGYTKRVHHDQLISQQRVQDTYTRLKSAHAKRLCDHWAEQTDSSKHVFEDLSIAAFLIELWKDMYKPSGSKCNINEQDGLTSDFPGFVDIGCGNGVLVDILLREGYKGWGFDARNRKSWAIFEPSTQRQLKRMILVPQPLLDANPALIRNNIEESPKLLSKILHKSVTSKKTTDKKIEWHNGIFPTGTFIISNHADELTPWTPLLAYLSSSPFLMIPCCSHNLSGLRFRAPSKFNGYSADTLAPPYFAGSVTKSKSVAITIAPTVEEDEQPRQGSLKDLNPSNRAKQPSAYAALCDWVSHLATAVGYEVEKEMMRLPSTRNTGLVGRNVGPSAKVTATADRMEKVKTIALEEGADGAAWVERAKGLMSGKGEKH